MATLERRLSAAVEELGFGLFAAVLTPAEGRRVLLSNTPAGFVALQRDPHDVMRDPAAWLHEKSLIPFAYGADTYRKARAGDLWDAQAPFGYRSGIGCTLRTPGGGQLEFSVDRPDDLPSDMGALYRLFGAAQMLASHVQSALDRLGRPAPLPAAQLEPQELECLRWAADGKTVQQIGGLLVISERDAARRLQSAARKLGAATCAGAVLRLIEGGSQQP